MNTKHEPVCVNKLDQKWEKMLPDLGKDSPLFTLLRVDPQTAATTLMIDFPTAIHIPKHTHEKSETHIILRGSHLFENSDTGERFDIKANGYFYLPGHIVHEAWVPAGSQAIIILEDGWKVNWLEGPPTAEDVGKGAPPRLIVEAQSSNQALQPTAGACRLSQGHSSLGPRRC
ncbi:MAG: AraC family ligand binding domain-containing protein [Gemmataceae bacterium]|nr:AraC family ligand binding domain-containing protein [Gemmataceae bacterium]